MRSLRLSGSFDRQPTPFRPRLEALEDRNLPSTLTVLNLSDHDPGSLRDVITQAQNGDTIQFDPSVRGTITLQTDLLVINKSLTIVGPGADQLAVSGNHRQQVFILEDSANVSIANLAVLAGQGGYGGGFVVYAGTTLSLTACLVRDNAAYFGGGIYSEGVVTIQDSNLSWNSADGFGGAVLNRGQLTVSGSFLENNSTRGPGGGVYNQHGTVSVVNSVLGANSATDGGGIYTNGPTFVTSTVIHDCSASNNGGGINGSSLFDFQVTDCNLNANSAGHEGGGIYSSNSYLTVNTSSFSNNTATGNGGGLRVDRGAVTLSRTTLGGNQAGGDGGAIFSSSAATLVSSTVVANHARNGAGVYNDTSLFLDNTIVAGNFRTGSTYPTDLDGFPVSSASVYNLIGLNGWGGMTNGVNHNQVGVADVGLDTLGDNGGPSWTMAPLAGSPVLNAGDPALIGTTDQRGVARTGGVNIGAYQASAAYLTITTSSDATAGIPFQLTVTVYDVFGNVAVGYTGTVVLSRNDGPDPVEYAFTAADAGSHNFTVMVENAGSVTFLVRDRDNDAVYGALINLLV